MNTVSCLGLHFLAHCSEFQYKEHFLFNFETAIAGLAMVVSIYALLIEKRFRIRVSIKKNERVFLLKLIASILGLTFIGAILPFIPGDPLPLIGYPVFWEFIASVLIIYTIYLSYIIISPIKSFSKKQIRQLLSVVPQATRKYHGSLDLMLKEADLFWGDFLKKSQENKNLQTLLIRDFANPDFIKLAVTSHYILIKTYQFIGESPSDVNKSTLEFFRKLFIHNLVEDDSVIAEDLESDYKLITQEIIRKYKLGNTLFKGNGDLFFLRLAEYKNWLNIYRRFSILFKLYLGKRYHHTEDTKNYISLIDSEVIEVFLEFFKENLTHLTADEKDEFMSKFAFSVPEEIGSLPEAESKALANGIYELLEQYAAGKEWQNEEKGWRDFHILYEFKSSFVDCNKITKQVFKERLTDMIAGAEDDKKTEYLAYNLKGFYPMVLPIYFYMYGPELFSRKEPKEDREMHMRIIKKMQKNLPIISQGITQFYMSDKKLPLDERGKEAIRRKAEKALVSMFPNHVFYNKDDNSITYISSQGEKSITLLLDETIKSDSFVYKQQ